MQYSSACEDTNLGTKLCLLFHKRQTERNPRDISVVRAILCATVDDRSALHRSSTKYLADSCAADVTSRNLLCEGKNRRLFAISHVSPTYFSIRFCAPRDGRDLTCERSHDRFSSVSQREIVTRPENLLRARISTRVTAQPNAILRLAIYSAGRQRRSALSS